MQTNGAVQRPAIQIEKQDPTELMEAEVDGAAQESLAAPVVHVQLSHTASVVTTQCCWVTLKTTINASLSLMCHSTTFYTRTHTLILPCFSQPHHARHDKSPAVSLLLRHPPHPPSSSSVPPLSLLFFPLFSRTTNYFLSHDQAAPSPHYQLIDRPRCFFFFFFFLRRYPLASFVTASVCIR